jgi:ElaB/YqjD/DUF883 family membrane-anchored ribosome-binding protein
MGPERKEPTVSNYHEFPSGQDMAEEAARQAETARNQAREVIGQAGEQGGGAQLNERLNQGIRAASKQMGSMAQQVRQRAPEGQAGEVAQATASVLDRGADYLQGADIESLQSDLERMIRRSPLQALAIGVGVGFLIGRTLKR